MYRAILSMSRPVEIWRVLNASAPEKDRRIGMSARPAMRSDPAGLRGFLTTVQTVIDRPLGADSVIAGTESAPRLACRDREGRRASEQNTPELRSGRWLRAGPRRRAMRRADWRRATRPRLGLRPAGPLTIDRRPTASRPLTGPHSGWPALISRTTDRLAADWRTRERFVPAWCPANPLETSPPVATARNADSRHRVRLH